MMPAITPGYLYSFLALLAVSGLLVASFMAYANTLRSSSEAKTLKNLMDVIASRCTELLAMSASTSVQVETSIQIPRLLGNTMYWVRLRNDSSYAWVEGGLGDVVNDYAELRSYVPKDIFATGTQLSTSGMIVLECGVESGTTRLRMDNAHEGE